MKISNGVKNLIRKFIPHFLLNWYHFFLAGLGAFLYRFPSSKLKVIGITGTNGKSTVVHLTTKILEEAGYKVASISSIQFKINKKEWKNTLKMTMPGRTKLQKFLRQAVNADCQYAVLEVTSEGIKQHRHRFIDFDVAVFTNLTPEHIESHGGFENYRKAKGKLFQATKKTHIINLDDKNSEYFLRFPADKKYAFSVNRDTSSSNIQIIKARDIQLLSNGLKFSVNNICFRLKLLGKFNISNALAAICCGLSQGIDLKTCRSALEKIKGIPGRMEVVIKKPFTVIVDYAHTPDGLIKVYKTVKNLKPQNNKLICVLGAAGGGRDKWKRPELGKIAAKYCDEIILTNEDPYDELPIEIINQIAEGIENISINQQNQHKSAVHKILDRRKAIKKALNLAKPDDVVIITGKGCEPWMCVAGNKKIPWDDRKIVKEECSVICQGNLEIHKTPPLNPPEREKK